MDQNYALYLHFENLKNSLYRQMYGARNGYFKIIYSWFYTNERTQFNLLTLRQKLGTDINDDEINQYNTIRVIYFN